MSHFNVLVISDYPSKATITKLMQPYHEFECTGEDDEYVVDVDETEEKRAEYENGTVTRLQGPDGSYHKPYEDRFFRDPTDEELVHMGDMPGSGCGRDLSWHSKDWGDGKGYRPKVRLIPDGFAEVKVSHSNLMSFNEYMIEYCGFKSVPFGEQPDLGGVHKFGYAMLDEEGGVTKVIRRTNPNDKWDWWVIGGRWNGFFQPGYDPQSDERNFELCWTCNGTGKRDDELGRQAREKDPAYTCNRCRGTGKALKFNSEWVQCANQVQVKDLDLQAHKKAAVAEREQWIASIETSANLSRAEMNAGLSIQREANQQWSKLPEPRPRGGEFVAWLNEKGGAFALLGRAFQHSFNLPILADGETVEQWIAASPALSVFAVVKDGQWFSRGEMGWFGVAHHEKDDEAWGADVEKLLAGLPPEKWLTVVDCHC